METEDQLTEKDIKEYHESGGEVVPEAQIGAEKAEAKQEVKQEVKQEAPDPHAENHAKALKETREQYRKYRQETEKELKARDERYSALEKRLNDFMAQLTAKPEPNPQEQPIEYVQHKTQKTEAELDDLKKWRQQQEQQNAHMAQLNAFKARVHSAAQPFIAQTKDYPDAYQHVLNMKGEELRLAGIPEEKIPDQLGIWEMNFAAASIQSERSPSEALYQLATKLGYKPKGDEVKQNLERVRRGQEAAKTLSGGGGDISLTALEQMSDDQIRELAKDPKKWLKLAKG